jgi:nucleoside diphosphate kinase
MSAARCVGLLSFLLRMAESALEKLRLELYEPSYFADSSWARPLLDRLSAEMPDEVLRQLKTTAFALVKPDAIVSGRASKVIEHLRWQGLEPVEAWPLLNPMLRQFEELYKFNLTLQNEQNQISSWWINSQVYVMAPSMLMLVACPQDPTSVHRRLAASKGPSSPHRGSAGHLRFDLRACNKTLNLIHCADDPLSTAREYLIFRGLDGLRNALSRRLALNLDSVHSIRSAVDLQLKALERSLGLPLHHVDITDTLQRLISLTIHALCANSESIWRASEWDQIQECIHGISASKRPNVTAYEAAAHFVKAGEVLNVMAQRVTAPSVLCSDLLSLLQVLTRPHALDDLLVEDGLKLLEYCGMPLSRWDSLVLRSSVHYADDWRDLFSHA